MSMITETCPCGAEWRGPSIHREDRERFREAHSVCRQKKEEPKRLYRCPICNGIVDEDERVVVGVFVMHEQCAREAYPGRFAKGAE